MFIVLNFHRSKTLGGKRKLIWNFDKILRYFSRKLMYFNCYFWRINVSFVIIVGAKNI